MITGDESVSIVVVVISMSLSGFRTTESTVSALMYDVGRDGPLRSNDATMPWTRPEPEKLSGRPRCTPVRRV